MMSPLTSECKVNTDERHTAVLALLVSCDTLDLLPENFISAEDLANALRNFTKDSRTNAYANELYRQSHGTRGTNREV